MANERSGAATVIVQEGDRVQVEHRGEKLTVAMRGFPTGFRLNPGSRVILADESSGPVARPLVRALTSRQTLDAVEKRATLQVEGKRLEMQPSTVTESTGRPEEKNLAVDYDVWIAERGDDLAPRQVVAVRRRQ